MHRNTKVDDGHLVLVRQEIEHDKGHCGVASHEGRGDTGDGQRHILPLVSSSVELLVHRLIKHTLAGPSKVLELEDARIVEREAFLQAITPRQHQSEHLAFGSQGDERNDASPRYFWKRTCAGMSRGVSTSSGNFMSSSAARSFSSSASFSLWKISTKLHETKMQTQRS
jgi:hypothetical protein